MQQKNKIRGIKLHDPQEMIIFPKDGVKGKHHSAWSVRVCVFVCLIITTIYVVARLNAM